MQEIDKPRDFREPVQGPRSRTVSQSRAAQARSCAAVDAAIKLKTTSSGWKFVPAAHARKCGCSITESDSFEQIGLCVDEYVGLEELNIAASDLCPCEEVRHVRAPITGSHTKHGNDRVVGPSPEAGADPHELPNRWKIRRPDQEGDASRTKSDRRVQITHEMRPPNGWSMVMVDGRGAGSPRRRRRRTRAARQTRPREEA